MFEGVLETSFGYRLDLLLGLVNVCRAEGSEFREGISSRYPFGAFSVDH